MRVSDTERQRTIDELRRHCAAGRLDVDEYAGRVEQVLAAATLEELDRVLADLPMMRIADPAGARADRRNSLGRSGSDGDADQADEIRRTTSMAGRLGASVLVILSVVIVVGAVLLALLASWSWVAVLLGGWLIGVTQAGLARRRL